jgi:LysM repeat protein
MKRLFPYFHLIGGLLVSVSGLSAQVPANKLTAQQYIARYKDIAIAEMYRSNVPASITLAQGMLESSLGNSELATVANNHFGVKCKGWPGPTFYMWDDDPEKSCFRKYRTPEDSYLDHSDFLVTGARYKNCFLQGKDYKAWAVELRKAGYATNPTYADLLIERVVKYQLHQYDTATLPPLAGAPASVNQGVEFNDNPEVRNRKLNKLFESYQTGIFEKNGLRFAVAKKGEDPLSFATRFNIPYAKFLKYNEMTEDDLFVDFQFAFFQPKRYNYRGEEDYHVVLENESLYAISQFYGIRLEALQKMNKMPPNTDPLPGDTLQLKKPVDKPVRYKPATARPKRRPSAPDAGQGQVQPGPAPERVYAATAPGVNAPVVQAPGPAELPKEYTRIPTPEPSKPVAAPDQGAYGNAPFWETAAPAPDDKVAPPPAPAPKPQPVVAAQPPKTPPAAGTQRQHTVAPGENLYRISLKYKIGMDALKKANGLTSDALSEGQILRIP